MKYLKKNWLTILFLLFIALQFIPATSFPIKVFLNKLISFAPSEIVVEKREKLENYTWELTSIDNNYTNLTSSKGNVLLLIYGQLGALLVLQKCQLFKTYIMCMVKT